MTLTLAASLLLAAVGGATPSPPPVVVRVTTELVQVDAVVLDNKGQHVTDLTAADFEITERGRKQVITHCQYVPVESSPSAEGRAADGAAGAWSPPKREETKRVVVMMVDDLGLSMEGMNLTKEALVEFVDERMGTADLVAVVRTGGVGGMLQQLTNDRALLRASVSQLRYNGLAMQAKSPREIVADRHGHPSEITVEHQRKSALALRTIRAIQSTARGMEGLPGRKSIVVFSNTLLLKAAPVLIDGAASQALEMDAGMVEAMHELAQTASRASVVIHSVDPRGHGAAFLAHRAEYEGPRPRDMRLVREETLDDHAGLGHMADETGGTFQCYINDARGAVERVMHQLRGYYLIGYTPETSSDPKAGDGGRYHEVSVRVTRPGLKVRSRKGYYGTTEEERELAAQASTTMAAAAGSPFASTDLRVSVTALFGYDGSGSSVRTIVHVDWVRAEWLPSRGDIRVTPGGHSRTPI